MKYNINQFRAEFPNDDVCLEYIFRKRFPDAKQYYRVKGRRCYQDMHGKQIHPIAGTVFEKSSTSLTNWFYAIYLFAASRNGVSAKELQRQLGVTYKTAWRMGKQIRALMEQKGDKLSGIVEADETYMGGKKIAGKDNKNLSKVMKSKTIITGAVERGGRITAKIAPDTRAMTLYAFIARNVERKGTRLMTDENNCYKQVGYSYKREMVKHKHKEYARGDVHTNTIEGFWGQFKNSVRGTYHSVSRKHLQTYVNEFSFRYNHRSSSVFEAMMERI